MNIGLLGFSETYELVPTPLGTEIRHSAEVRLEALAVLLAPVLRMALGSQLKRDFQALKKVLESTPAAAHGSAPAVE
jgi:hypothetical protein